MLTTVTILALIYVPITAITSVFGMNVKQINGTGHHISRFVLTAVVALIMTWITWFVAEAVHSMRNLRAKRSRNPDPAQTEFNLPLRMSLLVWLLAKGYWKWTWRSGAMVQILTNSSRDLQQEYSINPHFPQTACDYVEMALIGDTLKEKGMFPADGFNLDRIRFEANDSEMRKWIRVLS